MFKKLKVLACVAIGMSATVAAQTITIATVNNGDMITMKELSGEFENKNPGIDLQWVTLEENILRQRVTTDVATGGGQYDVMTIGTYEVPIWGKQGWLKELDNLGESYDVDDLLPAVRSGLTIDNKLFAAPFYAESSMVMYRTDLIKKAGLEMPKAPT
ncbi:MAG: sorbitol/mannitol transport system substrate-binding protein, partial [Paraglaciecola sp.]